MSSLFVDTTGWEKADYAQHYTSIGLGLVRVAEGEKAPRHKGWNDPANAISDPDEAWRLWSRSNENMGLLHGASGTCVIDVDDEEGARCALASVGIDLDQLLQANPFRIRGKKGEKPVYRVPQGEELSHKKLSWPARDASGSKTPFSVLELRTGNQQDVLPPSVHPDTGLPYVWVNGAPRFYEDIPELPREVLMLWRNHNQFLPMMQSACPWAQQAPTLPQKTVAPDVPEGEKVISAFNRRHHPGEVLERNGYTAFSGGRWLYPASSTGSPGVTLLPEPNKQGHVLVYSNHVGDPLADGHSHDAFSVFTVLEYGGDVRAAAKAAAKSLGMTKAYEGVGQPDDVAGELYSDEGGVLTWYKPTKDGAMATPLTNFAAYIVAETVQDDGAERVTTFTLEGRLRSGQPLPRIEVPANKFQALNWVSEDWGARAIVNAGQNVRQHVPVAIQSISQKLMQRRDVFTHTGWRETPHGLVYLSASGALGAQGFVEGLEVALPQDLARYALPEPAVGEELRQAIRDSVQLWDLAPDSVTVPLWLGTYRPLLGPADFSLLLVGLTGLGKTQLAAVMLGHYGPEQSAQGLPGWHSTANYLEKLAFRAKDALLPVDDFNPTGSAADQARYHATAERLLRAQGNTNGRGRLNDKASFRQTGGPRGLILITAEDLPKGHSAVARSLVLRLAESLTHGEASAALSRVQKLAAQGVYARALSAFVVWLAPQLDTVKSERMNALVRHRGLFKARHARTTNAAADLLWTWEVFARFAQEVGALTPEEVAMMKARAVRALNEVCAEQASHHEDADPVQRYLDLLSAGLMTRQVHLEHVNGDVPDNPERYGWRAKIIGTGDYARLEYQPQGRCIGWIAGDEVYLQPEQAYAEARRLAEAQGEPFTMSRATLQQRLYERKLLRAREVRHLSPKRQIQGRRVRVLVIGAETLGLSVEGGAGGADGAEAASVEPSSAPPQGAPAREKHMGTGAEPSAPEGEDLAQLAGLNWGELLAPEHGSGPGCPTGPTPDAVPAEPVAQGGCRYEFV